MKTTMELAREAGASTYTNRHFLDRPFHTFSPEQLETFAALLRAEWEAEREKTKPLPGADWTITMRRMMNSGCSKRECTCKPENAENCIWWDEPGDAPQPAAQPQPLTDDQIYEMYNEPRSDAEMVAFARAIEAAHNIRSKE